MIDNNALYVPNDSLTTYYDSEKVTLISGKLLRGKVFGINFITKGETPTPFTIFNAHLTSGE